MENKQYRIKKWINIKLPKIERKVSVSAGRSKLSCTLFIFIKRVINLKLQNKKDKFYNF